MRRPGAKKSNGMSNNKNGKDDLKVKMTEKSFHQCSQCQRLLHQVESSLEREGGVTDGEAYACKDVKSSGGV
jgi:hypothetical protein